MEPSLVEKVGDERLDNLGGHMLTRDGPERTGGQLQIYAVVFLAWEHLQLLARSRGFQNEQGSL